MGPTLLGDFLGGKRALAYGGKDPHPIGCHEHSSRLPASDRSHHRVRLRLSGRHPPIAFFSLNEIATRLIDEVPFGHHPSRGQQYCGRRSGASKRSHATPRRQGWQRMQPPVRTMGTWCPRRTLAICLTWLRRIGVCYGRGVTSLGREGFPPPRRGGTALSVLRSMESPLFMAAPPCKLLALGLGYLSCIRSSFGGSCGRLGRPAPLGVGAVPAKIYSFASQSPLSTEPALRLAGGTSC